jgi:hypothetical protein
MPHSDTCIVRHGGREFVTTSEMARIFRKQAERIIAQGASELVVLRHAHGVDMVLVTGRASYSIQESNG